MVVVVFGPSLSLSRSNGGHPQQEGTDLGLLVPVWPGMRLQICVYVFV